MNDSYLKKHRSNSSRIHLYKVIEEFGESIPKGSIVLDAGAGEQYYKEIFSHVSYEAADFEKVDKEYAKSTYVCDLKNIPTEDERFDFIIFNQVMEHLPEPIEVLNELNRVLKKGGKMLYTGPLFYEEHEIPYDFYRYTQFGLTFLFNKADFQVEKLEWLEGYYGTISYQLNRMSRYLPNHRGYFGGGLKSLLHYSIIILLKPLFRNLSTYFNNLDLKYKYKKGYPKNYYAILVKE